MVAAPQSEGGGSGGGCWVAMAVPGVGESPGPGHEASLAGLRASPEDHCGTVLLLLGLCPHLSASGDGWASDL